MKSIRRESIRLVLVAFIIGCSPTDGDQANQGIPCELADEDVSWIRAMEMALG